MEDLINRLRVCATYGFKQEICKEAADAIESLISENNRLKTETERQWISVTSYLPKTDGRFMVTVKGRRGKPHVEMRNFHGGSRTWELQCSGESVIAWQPRPRPYGWKPKGDMQNVSV